MNKLYSDLKIEDLGSSKLKVSATLSSENLKEIIDRILEDKTNHMVMPGFRKGEAPKELVAKHIGEDALKSEALRTLAADAFAQIAIDKELKIVGTPNINIDESDSDIKIEVETAVLPEIELPDYKEIAKKHNSEPEEEVKVEDKDVDEVILHLRREKARILALQKGTKPEDMPDFTKIDEKDLPQLDEQDFKELAGAEDEKSFREKVKEQILTERKLAQKEARRAALLEEIAEKSKVDLPEELVELEVQRSLDLLTQDLAAMGLTLDMYLQQIGKSLEELKEELKTPARKRVILQLALNKIAELENIKPDEQEVQKELEHLKQHYPQAQEADLRVFIESQKMNEAVINFLESIK